MTTALGYFTFTLFIIIMWEVSKWGINTIKKQYAQDMTGKQNGNTK